MRFFTFLCCKISKEKTCLLFGDLIIEAVNASFSRIWQKAVTIGIPTEEDCTWRRDVVASSNV